MTFTLLACVTLMATLTNTWGAGKPEYCGWLKYKFVATNYSSVCMGSVLGEDQAYCTGNQVINVTMAYFGLRKQVESKCSQETWQPGTCCHHTGPCGSVKDDRGTVHHDQLYNVHQHCPGYWSSILLPACHQRSACNELNVTLPDAQQCETSDDTIGYEGVKPHYLVLVYSCVEPDIEQTTMISMTSLPPSETMTTATTTTAASTRVPEVTTQSESPLFVPITAKKGIPPDMMTVIKDTMTPVPVKAVHPELNAEDASSAAPPGGPQTSVLVASAVVAVLCALIVAPFVAMRIPESSRTI